MTRVTLVFLRRPAGEATREVYPSSEAGPNLVHRAVLMCSQGLSQCAALLRRVGETFWADKMDALVSLGEELLPADAGRILNWFGGMGSLNDLIISPGNKHLVTAEEQRAVNRKLEGLTSVIYREARALLREGDQ